MEPSQPDIAFIYYYKVPSILKSDFKRKSGSIIGANPPGSRTERDNGGAQDYNCPVMRTFAAVALNWLHQLAMSLWLGGILVFGAVTAPAVFGTAKRMGQTTMADPLYNFAGTAITEGFRRFNYVVLVSGVLLLVSGLAYGHLAGLCPVRLKVRALLVAAGLGLAAWLTFGMFPQLLAAKAQGQMALFDRLHHTYSLGFQAQMVLLLGVAALTAYLHLDRTPHARREPVVRGEVSGASAV